MSTSDRAGQPVRHDWLQHEGVLERFEGAWQKGGTVRIADFLPPVGADERGHLLYELIKIDLEYRWKSGEERRVEQYAREFPELGDVSTLPIELIREELRVRRQFQTTPPTLAELDERFPGHSAELSEFVRDAEERAPADVDLSRRLGRYELRERVGQGAFATVYRAFDPELGREVAIKIPRSEFLGVPDSRERIEREAASAARLRHPAIVPIHEVGQDGDRTYIVYDFIPGPTLAELLRQTRPAPQQAAEWVARVAEALDYAHQCGIVHRDVKPANIMMDRNGEPMVADFGLALQTDAGATLTQQGDILGTPAYMAPEQARGEGHQADARTDVYSLGVLLYELLSGRPPFQGTGASVLHSVMYDEPDPPRRSRLGVPPDLETICLKAMAKERARRYASAGAMADDLRRYLSHRPISARRIGPAGRLALWCRRKPALAATVALAVAVSSTVASLSFWRVVEERNRAEANLYRALVDGARAQMDGCRTGWWWKAMDSIRQAAELNVAGRDAVELRELAIECMGTSYPCFRINAAWRGHSGPVTSLAVSADGRFVVSGSRDRTVRVWALPSGEHLAVFADHTDAVTGVACHPDGRHFASSSADGTVRLRELVGPADSTKTPAVFHLNAGPISGIDFSLDGNWLAAAGGDGNVYAVPIGALQNGNGESLSLDAQPEGTRIFSGHTGAVTCVAFSPTGRVLAAGSVEGTIRQWSVATSELIDTVNVRDPPRTLAFMPKSDTLVWATHETYGFGWRATKDMGAGQSALHNGPVNQVRCDAQGRILTASGDGRMKLWSHREIKELAIAHGEFGSVRSVALDSTGRWVVAGHQDGQIRVWELTEPHHRVVTQGVDHYAVFGASDRRLFTTARVHDFSTAARGQTRGFGAGDRHRDLIWGVAISPDERLVATASHDRTVKLWSVRDMTLERTLQGHHDLAWCVAFSPDSKHLASGSEWAKGDEIVGEIKVWEAETGSEVHHLEGHRRQVVALAYHPTRPWFASGSLDGSIVLWDSSSGEAVGTVHQFDRPVHNLAFDPTGRWLAAACHDLPVAVWDITKLNTTNATHPPDPSPPAPLPTDGARGDGVDSGSTPSVPPATLLAAPDRLLSGHAGAVWAVTFSPDGRYLATAADDGVIVLWDGKTFSRVVTLRGPTDRIRSVSFSHDGQLLAGAALNSPTIVWDIAQLRQTLREMHLDW